MMEAGNAFSIEAWAADHGVHLFCDENVCYFYTSSDRGECFQIVIRPPLSGHVLIEAFSIETLGDQELHRA